MAQIGAEAANAARHAWHSFAPGARVYDHESGQDATVLSSTILHSIQQRQGPVPAAAPASLFNLPVAIVSESVSARLDSGQLVTRDASELVPLPPGIETLAADFAPPGSI